MAISQETKRMEQLEEAHRARRKAEKREQKLIQRALHRHREIYLSVLRKVGGSLDAKTRDLVIEKLHYYRCGQSLSRQGVSATREHNRGWQFGGSYKVYHIGGGNLHFQYNLKRGGETVRLDGVTPISNISMSDRDIAKEARRVIYAAMREVGQNRISVEEHPESSEIVAARAALEKAERSLHLAQTLGVPRTRSAENPPSVSPTTTTI